MQIYIRGDRLAPQPLPKRIIELINDDDDLEDYLLSDEGQEESDREWRGINNLYSMGAIDDDEFERLEEELDSGTLGHLMFNLDV